MKSYLSCDNKMKGCLLYDISFDSYLSMISNISWHGNSVKTRQGKFRCTVYDLFQRLSTI